MITVKDLFDNDELMDDLIEGLVDIPEDAEVVYSVWALGYDCEDDCTDAEYLIGEFDDPDEAVKCAESLTLETFNKEYEKPNNGTTYLSIEVETVVGDPDDEDGGTMNIGTIYQRDLWLDGEYGDALAAGLGGYSNVVCIAKKDFELLDDGTLKVSCELLRDFNKNDCVMFEFVDEAEPTVLEYKIMSKVIYSDGDYYHCELMI